MIGAVRALERAGARSMRLLVLAHARPPGPPLALKSAAAWYSSSSLRCERRDEAPPTAFLTTETQVPAVGLERLALVPELDLANVFDHSIPEIAGGI